MQTIHLEKMVRCEMCGICHECVRFELNFHLGCNFLASQMWLLGRVLPCMIGHLIPPSDEKWQNFTLLLQIMDIVFAHWMKLHIYKMLIGEHHQGFFETVPGELCDLKNALFNTYAKTDYQMSPFYNTICSNIPAQIPGPLIRHWTMRFEARHNTSNVWQEGKETLLTLRSPIPTTIIP